jgi:hypothetical protein
MPTEYYVGIAIGLVVVVLLGLLLKPRRSARPAVQQRSSGTDPLIKQLSRIADSLEILVAHSGASPSPEKPLAVNPAAEIPPTEMQPMEKQTEEPAVPPRSASAPSDRDEGKADQPPERHVRLSMFGR